MIDKTEQRLKATEDALRETIDERENRLLVKIDEIKFLTDKLTEQVKHLDGEGSSVVASNRVVQ